MNRTIIIKYSNIVIAVCFLTIAFLVGLILRAKETTINVSVLPGEQIVVKESVITPATAAVAEKPSPPEEYIVVGDLVIATDEMDARYYSIFSTPNGLPPVGQTLRVSKIIGGDVCFDTYPIYWHNKLHGWNMKHFTKVEIID